MLNSPVVLAVGAAVTIRLDSVDQETAAEVVAAWRDATIVVPHDSPVDKPPAEVSAHPLPDHRTTLAALSTTVTLAAIEAQRGKLWMLHAAALVDANGRVLALAGPSGRGKTTAARALGYEYEYLTDETAGITFTGDVLAYRKPLSIIESVHGEHTDPATRQVPDKIQVPASELGLKVTTRETAPLGRVVLLDRRVDGPTVPVLGEVDLAEAIELLVPETSYLFDLEEPLLTLAEHLCRTGGVVRVTYREAGTLPDAVEGLTQATPIDLDSVIRPMDPVPVANSDQNGPRFHRTSVRDYLTLNDGAIFLLDRPGGETTFQRLSPLGTTIWMAADNTTLGQITDAVIATHGEHPDGPQVSLSHVADAVDRLISAGVMSRSVTEYPAP